MTATLTPPSTAPQPVAPARRGSLLRAEAHRLWSRRFIRLLVVVGALGFAAALALASTRYAQPSAEVTADAQRRLEQVLAEGTAYHQQCLTREVPQGASPEEFCGQAPTAELYGGPEQFIDKRPFQLVQEGLTGAGMVAGATAASAFLIGATWIGAEWSSRSLVALLFWEPRRVRVLGAKLAVLVGATAVLAASAQGVWAVAARVLASTRGVSTAPPGFAGDLAATAGRGVLLTVLVGLLGFALAHLMRSTAAALGIGFVYFAIVESAVRGVRPGWQEWLLTNNAAALVQEGGGRYYVYEQFFDADGVFQYTDREVVVSNLHGGVVLTVAVLVAVGVGTLLFSRRDLT